MVRQLVWPGGVAVLTYRPVTPKIVGSNPIRVAILANLGTIYAIIHCSATVLSASSWATIIIHLRLATLI